jgi:hypothetical protein
MQPGTHIYRVGGRLVAANRGSTDATIHRRLFNNAYQRDQRVDALRLLDVLWAI